MSSNLSSLHKVSDLGFILISEIDIKRSPIFLQVIEFLRAWDGNDIITLFQHPCDGELRCAAAFLFSQGLKLANKVDVLFAITFHKSRHYTWAMVFGITQGLAFRKCCGEHSSAQWHGGHHCHTQFATGSQEIGAFRSFDIKHKWGVLNLDRSYRSDFECSTKGGS